MLNGWGRIVSSDIYAFRNCEHNLRRALLERFDEPGRLARERIEQHFDADLYDSAIRISRKLGYRYSAGFKPWTEEQVLASYEGGKRKLYARVYDSIRYSKPVAKWCKIEPFVKVEKYTFYDKPNRIPRPIQPPTKEMRAFMARYMKPIEGRMKKMVLPGCVYPFLAKGMNSSGLAKRFEAMWGCFENPVALSLDLSKFDGTIGPLLRKLENEFFVLFGNDAAYRYCLRSFETDKYVVRVGGVKMRLNRGRASGENQTGAGNSLIMAVVCRVVFDFRCEIFANGDDTIVLFEKRELAYARARLDKFKCFGLDVREESCESEIEEVEWCQSRFTYTPSGPLWIRNWKRVLLTLVASNEYSPVKWRGLLKQMAYAEMVQNPGVPIIAPLTYELSKLLHKEKNYKFKFDQPSLTRLELIPKYERTYVAPTERDRDLFMKRTLISPSEQIALEKKLVDSVKNIKEITLGVYSWAPVIGLPIHPYG